ncbi:MAG: sugar transferase, partial [Hyphomicrobium sp.]
MHRVVLLVIDLCVVAIATVLAVVLRDNLVFSLDRLHGLLPYVVATLLAATVILPAFGLNRTLWRFSALSDYLRIVGGGIIIVLFTVAIGFLLNRLEGVARALPILQGILIVAALVGVRVAMRLRHKARKPTRPRALSKPEHSGMTETVLVFGLNTIAELFLQSVNEFAADRVKVAGLLGRKERHTGRLLRQHTILGTTGQLDSVLKHLEVHGVLVDRIVVTQAFDTLSPSAREALLYVEQTSDIRVDFFAERIGLYEDRHREATTPETQKRATDDERLLSISVDFASTANRPYWLAKRAIDVIGAACLIVLLAPLMGVVAVIVAIDVGVPTVFWQQRPGFRGRPFKLLKFRTMGAAHDNHGRRVQEEQR